MIFEPFLPNKDVNENPLILVSSVTRQTLLTISNQADKAELLVLTIMAAVMRLEQSARCVGACLAGGGTFQQFVISHQRLMGNFISCDTHTPTQTRVCVCPEMTPVTHLNRD